MVVPPAASRVTRDVALLGLGYFAAAIFAVALTRFEGGVAFIWVAAALLVADLRRRPPRQWPVRLAVCGLGSMVVTSLYGFGNLAAVPLSLVNLAEAAASAWLLRRAAPDGCFDTPREILVLIAGPGLAVPAVTGLASATVAHLCTGGPFWGNWAAWTTGHGLGMVTFAPLAVLLLGGAATGWARGAGRRGWLEAAALLGAVAAITLATFAQSRFPFLFLPFLPVMMAVLWLGRLGAAVSLGMLTLIATLCTLAGTGPLTLVDGGVGVRAQILQLYLAVATLMTLPIAAELKRRKRMFTRLQESAALYQVIADRTGDIILALEADGTIRYASPSVSRLGGHTPDAMIGTSAAAFVHEDDVPATVQAHRKALANPDETFMVEYRARRADGGFAWFETHTRATVDEEGRATGAVSVIREVSDRKARERDLGHAADTDPLTGALNRRGFEHAVAALPPPRRAGDRRGCIALFDLDHFKRVNDTHGHATGDDVIRAFAERLRETLRGSDLIARFGGEEFVVLLAGADLAQAETVCDRVRAQFAACVLSARDGTPLHLSVSGGLAPLDDVADLDTALEAADTALYRAKEAGRNRLALAA